MAAHSKLHPITEALDHSVGTLADGDALVRSGAGLAGLATATAATPITIPIRDASGDVIVPSSPSSGTAAASKDYVQSQVQGLDPKGSVDAATDIPLPPNTRAGDVLTANANGAFPTVDGVPAALNNEYLVKNEPNPVDNGIYVLTQLGDGGTPWQLTRRSDLEGGMNAAGAFLFVEQGTLNGELQFVCTADRASATVNVNNLPWSTISVVVDHQSTLNLQGGIATERQHMTTAEHDAVIKLRADVACAGAVPVTADMTGALWVAGDKGVLIGTDASIWFGFYDGVNGHAVEMGVLA